MSNASRHALLTLVCIALSTPAMGQSAPRTAYGDPDIQGLFTFRTLTPLQRPVIDAGASALLAGRETLTAEQAAEYEASRRRELNRDAQDLTVRAPGVRYQSLAEGGVGGYNEFWYERGIELTRDKRTSLIVDPRTVASPTARRFRPRRGSGRPTSETDSPTPTPTAACPTGVSWGSTPVRRWCRARTTTTC